jgi:hypothetical protein
MKNIDIHETIDMNLIFNTDKAVLFEQCLASDILPLP